MITRARAVIAQKDVDAKTNEITQVRPLLDDVDISGAPVTADALCRCRHNASYADPAVMPMHAGKPWSVVRSAGLPQQLADFAQRRPCSEHGGGRAVTEPVRVDRAQSGPARGPGHNIGTVTRSIARQGPLAQTNTSRRFARGRPADR